MSTIEETTIAALGPQLFIAADDDQNIWAGTEHWMVRRPDFPRRANPSKALDRVGTDVELTPARHSGGYPLLVDLNGPCRLYDRPDGTQVVLRDTYVQAVTKMLPSSGLYAMKQGNAPSDPVAWVAPDGQVVAVVMPIIGVTSPSRLS